MLPFPGSLRVCYDRQHCIVPSVCEIVGQIFALSHSHFIYRTRFAKAARVDDFNSRDIYSPERERTVVVLSAFINFIKFREQYCDAFLKDLRDRSDTLIAGRDDVTAKLKEVQDKVDELKWVHFYIFQQSNSKSLIRTQIVQDKPICEQLQTEQIALKNTMSLTKDAQLKVDQDVEQYTTEKDSLTKRKVWILSRKSIT